MISTAAILFMWQMSIWQLYLLLCFNIYAKITLVGWRFFFLVVQRSKYIPWCDTLYVNSTLVLTVSSVDQLSTYLSVMLAVAVLREMCTIRPRICFKFLRHDILPWITSPAQHITNVHSLETRLLKQCRYVCTMQEEQPIISIPVDSCFTIRTTPSLTKEQCKSSI